MVNSAYNVQLSPRLAAFYINITLILLVAQLPLFGASMSNLSYLLVVSYSYLIVGAVIALFLVN